MSESLSGKEKSGRVPLDYFRGRLGRKAAAWAAFGGLMVLVGWFWISGRWRQAVSPGPVHAAHAAWENQCALCHDGTLRPTGSRNGLHLANAWGAGLGGAHASDKLCKACHAAPVHHHAEREQDVASCAACHQEHGGRAATLMHVADAACVRCHGDLPAHHARGAASFGNVTAFDAAGHPAIRERKDSGKLRFNHALHLRAGLTHSDSDARKWVLADIAPEAKERYRAAQPEGRRDDRDAVQLACASCHQRDPTDQTANVTPLERGGGDVMLPVTFDQHCKACHPLKFDAKLPPAPHHLQPPELSQYLWGVLADKAVRDPALAKKLTDRPLPGVNMPREEAELRKRIAEGVAEHDAFLYQDLKASTERFVHSGRNACSLCHYYDEPKKIAPPRLPRLWFEHASFSHRAHRAVDCQQCHERAAASATETDVLLPGLDACIRCHAPARTVDGKQQGGVRHDCVTCHRYHHGDVPIAGRGAEARGVNANALRTVEEFLSGVKK